MKNINLTTHITIPNTLTHSTKCLNKHRTAKQIARTISPSFQTDFKTFKQTRLLLILQASVLNMKWNIFFAQYNCIFVCVLFQSISLIVTAQLQPKTKLVWPHSWVEPNTPPPVWADDSLPEVVLEPGGGLTYRYAAASLAPSCA